jgi:RND family efflux transporter MFP subunit
MKTKLVWMMLASLLIFTSCENTPLKEQLQTDLDRKKTELSALKLEVKELQQKINALDSTNVQIGIAVNLEDLKFQKFEHFFSANGSFEPVDYAYISPQTSGQITQIAVKEGYEVKKGDLLVKLNTDVLENNIREVKTALNLATTIFKKQEELWNKNIGSELDYLRAKNDMERMQDQLKTLQSQLDLSIITSPINGIVDKIEVKEGELAMPGAPMMHIVNLDEFYLNVEVSESYIPFLKKGDPVQVNLMAYGDLTLDAPIFRIANIINPENRSFEVNIKMKNYQNKIKPNMLADAKFKDFESEKAIVVPSLLVKKDFNGEYVFIAVKADDNIVAKKVYVETGKSIANTTMVVSGLTEGDRLIVKGYNQVVEGSLLSIK